MINKAIEYAEYLPVLPIIPNKKLPLIKAGAGFKNASQDVNQIKEWWTANPDANIGVIPAESGFFVFDVDMPNGKHTMEELGIWERMATDDSFQAYVTPSGGFHFWWKTDSKIIMEKTHVDLWEDIDILSANRQVIVPPSQTDEGRYAKEIDFSKVPKAPKWLEEMIETAIENKKDEKSFKADYTKRAGAFGTNFTGTLLDKIVEGIDEGERNVWLASITGSLLNTGMNSRNLLKFLHVINQNYIHPSLPAKEIDTVFTSISKKFIQERVGK